MKLCIALIVLVFFEWNLWGENAPTRKKVAAQAEQFEDDGSFAENLKKMSIPDSLKLKEVVIGNDDAPNTVIIYSSFTCSYCRKFHEEEFPKFKRKYVDTGKAKVYLRSYLDDLGALEASLLVRCFGGDSNDKIEDLYHEIFSRQEKWFASKKPRQFLKNMFKELGYGSEEIDRCSANTKISAGLMKEQQRTMHELKISLIPTFIVNGKIHKGTLTCKKLAAMLEENNKTVRKRKR
ncbi:MAG: DsbA family protein [Holosporaceae bacterium]|jgi:protein-disulfide isomerase|nr:DsbA family protein [Holosporaceae bacterium]